MIRVAGIAVFLFLFFLVGIPMWGVLWLIGRFDERRKQRIALSMVQGGFRCILTLCSATKTTVIGRERIPRDQAVLYVGNHRSFFDILIIYTLVPDLTGFVAKKEMERIPFLSTWMKLVNCLFLDRDDMKQGLKMILEGIDKLKRGISICIFPEGTRGEGRDETELLPFKEGSLKMAEKAGCLIIPVAMNHNSAIFEDQLPRVKRVHTVIEFGEPIDPKALDKEQRKFLGAYTRERIIEMVKKNQAFV